MTKNKPELPEHLKNFKPLLEIVCAFCKGRAQAVEFPDGSHGVTHSLPECAEFIALDPTSFLRENRKVFEREIAEGKTKAN